MPQPIPALRQQVLNEEQQAFLSYWRSKTHRGVLPKRADIDPLDIPKLLPNISLVDVLLDQNPVVYRARLLGTEITRHFGRDVTGKAAKQLYDERYLLQLETTYNQILDVRQPVLCKCQVPLNDGTMTAYYRFIAPLSSNGEQIDMLMSHFSFPANFPAANRHLPQAKSIWETVDYDDDIRPEEASA
ncbi:PAS domain-containing protein [Rhodovibrionaceae bacterium A322]